MAAGGFVKPIKAADLFDRRFETIAADAVPAEYRERQPTATTAADPAPDRRPLAPAPVPSRAGPVAGSAPAGPIPFGTPHRPRAVLALWGLASAAVLAGPAGPVRALGRGRHAPVIWSPTVTSRITSRAVSSSARSAASCRRRRRRGPRGRRRAEPDRRAPARRPGADQAGHPDARADAAAHPLARHRRADEDHRDRPRRRASPIYINTHAGAAPASTPATWSWPRRRPTAGWQFVRQVVLPGALPGFFVGLRLARDRRPGWLWSSSSRSTRPAASAT